MFGEQTSDMNFRRGLPHEQTSQMDLPGLMFAEPTMKQDPFRVMFHEQTSDSKVCGLVGRASSRAEEKLQTRLAQTLAVQVFMGAIQIGLKACNVMARAEAKRRPGKTIQQNLPVCKAETSVPEIINRSRHP
jgi:hypothetical protein